MPASPDLMMSTEMLNNYIEKKDVNSPDNKIGKGFKDDINYALQ